MTVNTPSGGTSSVAAAELEEHAAFHAARNARVSSPEALPDAPNSLTSNTAGDMSLADESSPILTNPMRGGLEFFFVSLS